MQDEHEHKPITLPEIDMTDKYFNCDLICPSVPFDFMQMRWGDVVIDRHSLGRYLERPDNFLQTLRELYDYQGQMQDDPQIGLLWGSNRSFIPHRFSVYLGLGQPMSAAPWNWIDRSDKYLTVIYETLRDNKVAAVTHYIKLSAHERIVENAQKESLQEIGRIVGNQINETVHRVVTDAIKAGTASLKQIEAEQERLEAQRDKLEKQLAELREAEQQAIQKVKSRREPTDLRGYVYLLKTSVGSWKIGRTRNPEDRLRTFSVKLPFDVEYAHLIECADMYTAESELHIKFADQRIGGSEFFALADEDVAYIKSITTL